MTDSSTCQHAWRVCSMSVALSSAVSCCSSSSSSSRTYLLSNSDVFRPIWAPRSRAACTAHLNDFQLLPVERKHTRTNRNIGLQAPCTSVQPNLVLSLLQLTVCASVKPTTQNSGNWNNWNAVSGAAERRCRTE